MGWKTDLIILDGQLGDAKPLLLALGYDKATVQAASSVAAMFPPRQLLIAEYAGCTLIAEPSLPSAILGKPDGKEARRLLQQFPQHGMLVCVLHSVVNLAAFSLYQHGQLVRAFAASSDDGVFTDSGEPLAEEKQLLARFSKNIEDNGTAHYQDNNGDVLTLADLGEELVFEVMARFTGQRPDEDDALFDAPARAYRKHSWLMSLLGR